MSNNPELGNNQSSEDDTNKWDILPKDNFHQRQQNSEEAPKSELSDEEIKQIIRARKRSEQLKNNAEAKKHASRVAAGFLAIAITATASIGGLVVASSKKDILESDRARQKIIEMENAKEIVFYGNVRSNPEIPNSEDPSNIYISIDDEVRIEVPEDSRILYYPNDKDPNGGWYGVPVDILEDESFISDREARKLEKDHDGYVWVNHNNASVTTGPESSSP